MSKPKPSEWGKLSAGQGFGLLASDFARALFGAGWGRYELILIGHIMEHSWGVVKYKDGPSHWPDPVPCRVNFNALAERLKLPRQRLYEARDSLIAKRFLTTDGAWINKNADEWIDPSSGRPILSPEMLAHALDARSRKPAKDKHDSVTPDRDIVSRSSVTNGMPVATNCHAPACHDVTLQRGAVSRSSVTSHYKERAEEDLKTREEDLKTGAGAAGGREGETEDAEKGFPVRCPEHRLTIEHARAAFGDKFALVVAQQGRDIELSTGGKWECFRAAIDAAKRSKKTISDLYGWCRKVAERYAIDGIPPEPVTVEARHSQGNSMAEKAERLRKRWGFDKESP